MPDDAYERGHVAGEIAARLADHDRHFAKINGSIADMTTEMHEVALGLQRLVDAMDSDRKTVVTTAAALKDAEAARRDKTEHAWSPLARVLAVIGSLATVASLSLAWYVATR
jgi:hypothetical protein